MHIERTPEVKNFKRRLRKLKTSVAVYKKRSAAYQARFKIAKQHVVIDNSGLRNEAVNFCLSQLRRKARKARGQHYSFNEKLMSLALYKSTGAGYKVLEKLF